MGRFSEYFGGKYMKFWYIAFGLVLMWMGLSYYNSLAVDTYEVTIYNTDGTVQATTTMNRMELVRKFPEMPAHVSYHPVKKFW